MGNWRAPDDQTYDVNVRLAPEARTAPEDLERLPFALGTNADGSTRLDAKVTMLCGCPITPGGLWDAANYRIAADVLDHGAVITHVQFHYAGQPSQFAADLPPLAGHDLTVQIVAVQANAPNTGVAELPLPEERGPAIRPRAQPPPWRRR